MVKVAELIGCCRKVTGSKRVYLSAGSIHYIKGVSQEGRGGDYFRVGMKRVGGEEYHPIPLSMFARPTAFSAAAFEREDGNCRRADGTYAGRFVAGGSVAAPYEVSL